MSEKGDMPPDHGDQVSLPPNYAPSEAYTESPPPAYSNKKSSMVAVTRMVCLTILAGAFMIGFFSLTHSWLQTRSCNCQHEDHDGIRSASFVEFPPAPQVEALVAHKEEEVPENTIITDINNNMSQLEEELNEQDKPKPEENGQIIPSDDIHPTIDEEVSALQQEVEILEEVESELEDERHILEESAQQEFDEVNKNIKIPLDVILGNPALSGRDVNCKVDRRQQDIGGLMTQAIIVTCEDKDDGPAITPLLSSPSSKRPLGPPLSLLAPIMKMLAAKAKQRSQEFNSMNLNKPEIIFGAKPVIMASKMSGPIEGPIRMIRGPFPGPMSGPSPFPMPAPRFLSMRGPNMSGPMRVPNMSGPMRGPNMSGPMRGPNMSGPRGPMPDPRGSPIPNFNENRRISDGGRQPKMIPMSINPMRMANGRSIRVLPFGKESRPDFFPNLPKDLPPFPNRPPAFPFKNEQELRILPEPQPRGLNSPIALPGLRILPGRFLNVFPQPKSPVRPAERAELPKPITHMEMRQPEHKPEPIAIPNFKPGPIVGPPKFHELPKPITHMEMRQPEHKVQPVVIPDLKPEGLEFGPPKVHTVIGPPIPPTHMPKFRDILPPMALPELPPMPPRFFNPHEPTYAPAPLHPVVTSPPAPPHLKLTSPPAPLWPQPSPPAPPHPKINPEGLTGIVSGINTDAEVFEPMADHASTAPTPTKHHLLVLN